MGFSDIYQFGLNRSQQAKGKQESTGKYTAYNERIIVKCGMLHKTEPFTQLTTAGWKCAFRPWWISQKRALKQRLSSRPEVFYSNRFADYGFQTAIFRVDWGWVNRIWQRCWFPIEYDHDSDENLGAEMLWYKAESPEIYSWVFGITGFSNPAKKVLKSVACFFDFLIDIILSGNCWFCLHPIAAVQIINICRSKFFEPIAEALLEE